MVQVSNVCGLPLGKYQHMMRKNYIHTVFQQHTDNKDADKHGPHIVQWLS